MRALTVVVALLALGCGDSEKTEPQATVCEAGRSVACVCAGGGDGAQSCKGDGTGYEACECGPIPEPQMDAGVPTDAGVDMQTVADMPTTPPPPRCDPSRLRCKDGELVQLTADCQVAETFECKNLISHECDSATTLRATTHKCVEISPEHGSGCQADMQSIETCATECVTSTDGTQMGHCA